MSNLQERFLYVGGTSSEVDAAEQPSPTIFHLNLRASAIPSVHTPLKVLRTLARRTVMPSYLIKYASFSPVILPR